MSGLPGLPGLPGLSGPGGGLVRAAPCARRPFGLGAPGVELRGNEMDGVESLVLDGRPVLEGLRSGGGTCSNVLASPRQLRRELVGAGGTVFETLLVTERPSGALLQWAPALEGGLALDLAWRHPYPATSWRASEGRLLLEEEGGGRTVVALVPPPDRWEAEPGPDGLSVRARVRTGGEPVSLLCLRGDAGDADLEGRLDRLARPALHETRAEGDLAEARTGSLALETGLPPVDEGLEWAKARLRSAAAGDDPLGELWQVLGLLAAGEHEAVRRRLPERPEHPAHLLALGEAVRWTGDVGLLRRRLEGVDRAVAGLGSAEAGGPGHGILLHAGLTAVADAAEAAGDRERAARWRGILPGDGASDEGGRGSESGERDRGAAAEGGRPGGVRLPVVGGGGAGSPAGLLRAVLGGEDAPAWRAPAAPPRDLLEESLRAWALYRTGAPDEAYLHLRARLESQDTDAFVRPPEEAALLPAVVLCGLLGARPDAAYGRLRLAPALPSNWTRLLVRSIRLGDAALDLAYLREGSAHTFTLTPTAGRVPVTVVFEPSVAAGGPGESAGTPVTVRVDGEPAEVDVARRGDRLKARLQIPVDRPRTVTLTTC